MMVIGYWLLIIGYWLLVGAKNKAFVPMFKIKGLKAENEKNFYFWPAFLA